MAPRGRLDWRNALENVKAGALDTYYEIGCRHKLAGLPLFCVYFLVSTAAFGE